MSKFRKGLLKEEFPKYLHFKDRIDTESLFDDLGIEISHRVGPNQIMCRCPFGFNHKNNDANPSFGYSEEKMAFQCFTGCASGNIIELIKTIQNINDEAATKVLEQHSYLKSNDDLLERIQKIMHKEEEDIMPEYPEDNLFQYRKIHPYLYKRGLTKDVIMQMQVGYDEDHYGIIIPHFFMDKLRGWQTRHLAYDYGEYLCPICGKDGKKVPKYKSTSRFPKRNTLYGYDQLKELLKKSGVSDVIVVESPFTALYLKSQGFERVVATFGSFNQEQAMLLLPIQTIYFWPDHDNAGKKNVNEARKSYLRLNNLKIIPVVPGEKGDAAELNKEQIEQYINAAYPASLVPKLGVLDYESAAKLTKTNTK